MKSETTFHPECKIVPHFMTLRRTVRASAVKNNAGGKNSDCTRHTVTLFGLVFLQEHSDMTTITTTKLTTLASFVVTH
jgi:hypothetical protein